jgi:hypothetical protein
MTCFSDFSHKSAGKVSLTMSAFEFVFAPDTCVICHSSICSSDVDNKHVTLTKKGLSTLIEFSNWHGDTELEQYLLSDPDVVNAHINCRKLYTDSRKLTTQTNVDGNDAALHDRSLRSKAEYFNWTSDCFFCDKPAVVDTHNPKRSIIISARTLTLRTNILQMCDKRQDAWGLAVKSRLQLCSDMVAAEAVYHKSCHILFCTNRCKPKGALISKQSHGGRSHNCGHDNVEMSHSFNQLCEWLETYGDAELYTLQELWRRMAEAAGGEDNVYSVKQFKCKLLHRYGEHLFFAEITGRKNVLCFRDMASYIINDKWHANKQENVEDERQRIVKAAAKLIKAEIRERDYNSTVYPTNEDVKNVDLGKQWVTPLLQALMETLIPQEVKQVAISHSIIQTVKPRSVITPTLYGVGVQMDHVLASKWLVNELARLGFSISYDEVTRYKQSVVQMDTSGSSTVEGFPGSFTQWVADNVDHNVLTLDGQGTFHGMGIISVSTPTDMHSPDQLEQAVPRLRRTRVNALVINRGIPVVPYYSSDVRGLSKLSYKAIRQLQSPYVLPPSTNLDLVWHSGWLVRDDEHPQPNWSGFMQNVSSGEHPSVANIQMLPIIDLNPSNESCIYSTLLFVQQQAQQLNIVTPCITFDQPLWIKQLISYLLHH